MFDMNTGDVEEAAEIFGFECPEWNDAKDNGKARRWLANKIIAHPLDVLNKMTAGDLIMMRQIIQNDSSVRANATHSLSPAVFMNIIDKKENGKYDFYDMPKEYIKAFAPHIDGVINDAINQVRFQMEACLIGLTNLYGIVTRGELIHYIEKNYSFDEDGNVRDFYGWLRDNSALIQLDDWDDSDSDDEVEFCSSFMWDDLDAFKREIMKEVKRKHFDKETVSDAGKFPVPTISNPFDGEMRQMLEDDFRFNEEETNVALFELWWRVQHQDDEDFEAGDYMAYILHELIPQAKPLVSGINALNRMLQTFIDYCNHIPRWILKGQSSSEVAELK